MKPYPNTAGEEIFSRLVSHRRSCGLLPDEPRDHRVSPSEQAEDAPFPRVGLSLWFAVGGAVAFLFAIGLVVAAVNFSLRP